MMKPTVIRINVSTLNFIRTATARSLAISAAGRPRSRFRERHREGHRSRRRRQRPSNNCTSHTTNTTDRRVCLHRSPYTQQPRSNLNSLLTCTTRTNHIIMHPRSSTTRTRRVRHRRRNPVKCLRLCCTCTHPLLLLRRLPPPLHRSIDEPRVALPPENAILNKRMAAASNSWTC